MEKLNETKQNEKKIFLKFEIFYENHPHTPYKVQKIHSLLVTNHLWQISYFQPIWTDF